MNNVGKAIAGIMFFLIVLTLITYIFLWVDRWNCDCMGGSYRIENDGMIQKSICEITTRTINITKTTNCLINGVKTNCSDMGVTA